MKNRNFLEGKTGVIAVILSAFIIATIACIGLNAYNKDEIKDIGANSIITKMTTTTTNTSTTDATSNTTSLTSVTETTFTSITSATTPTTTTVSESKTVVNTTSSEAATTTTEATTTQYLPPNSRFKATYYCGSDTAYGASGRTLVSGYSVASSCYPMGTILYIESDGTIPDGLYRVDDTGCASNIIDFFYHHGEVPEDFSWMGVTYINVSEAGFYE